MALAQSKQIIALDVGEKRIGVALADSMVRIASPLVTIPNAQGVLSNIATIINEHTVAIIIVGLPRNMSGDLTRQAAYCQEFAAKLRQEFSLPVYEQDETLTSVRAEAELESRRKNYQKSDIDSLAAVYILDDFLQNNKDL